MRLDGYHTIIELTMRDKNQNNDSLSKKTEFYERLEQKQANQAEIKEGFSFLNKETYEALPLTRWLDKSGHPIPGHAELPVEKAAEIKILSQKDPVPLELLLRSNLVQQELSRMNFNSLSLLDKMVQVTPQVMRMLGGLLVREVTRDDPKWAAAVASLTVSEKVKMMPSRRQNKENERDCRTIVQQLVSSIPHEVLTSTPYRNDTQKETVTFEDQDKEGEKVERNLKQDCLSGEMNSEKSRRGQDQHPGQGSLSGESDVDEKVLMRNSTWRKNFCPGSSDGCEEGTELIRTRGRALSQTLQWMTTPRTQESTPTQTILELRIETVRASDPHTASGDSSKGSGQGGTSRP